MRHALVALPLALAACSSDPPAQAGPKLLDRAALMDPSSCKDCHVDHYRQWSGSMHAYAAEDPVFLAMNARGQRETKGALGTFCVKCHAPMAVKTGATTDGLNLATLPPSMKGVTCYFCHSVASVDGAHDAPLSLAGDDVLRGPIADPASGAAHRSAYSKLHDGTKIESASLCGSCHDVQNGHGVDLARTFAEWKGSLFSHDEAGKRLTCNECHLPGRDAIVAQVKGVPLRRVHDHAMPAVDVALTPFPESDTQRALVQANLDPSLVAKLCMKPAPGGWQAEYSLDNAFAGHAWPSGAAYHRRAWVDLVGKKAGAIVFHTGDVAEGASLVDHAAKGDPSLWLLGDHMKDETGAPTEMLWSAAKVESNLLPPAVTNDKKDPAYYHAVIKTFDLGAVDEVEVQVRIRPIDYDFLDDLIATGDLDPSLRAKVPTFTLAGTTLRWTSDRGPVCVP